MLRSKHSLCHLPRRSRIAVILVTGGIVLIPAFVSIRTCRFAGVRTSQNCNTYTHRSIHTCSAGRYRSRSHRHTIPCYNRHGHIRLIATASAGDLHKLSLVCSWCLSGDGKRSRPSPRDSAMHADSRWTSEGHARWQARGCNLRIRNHRSSREDRMFLP